MAAGRRLIAPFWAVLDQASGRLLESSGGPADVALMYVDGWISEPLTPGQLLQALPPDPGGDASVMAYDPRRQTAVALRDRFGIHPLYYATAGGRIHVGSSIAALRSSGVRLVPDPLKNLLFVASHYRYFEFPERSTFFSDVFCLRPGEFLRVAPGTMEIGRYWDLAPLDLSGYSEDEIGAEFLRRLNRSVEQRLAIVDYPAFTLSSGMDSSTAACLAAKLAGPPVLVTTGFDVSTEYDESADVAATAKAIGGKWMQLKITAADVLDTFERFSAGADEPCATVTQMLHRIVTERVRDMGHDALFSGLGGDEASCGEIEEYLYYFADLRRLGMDSRIEHDMRGWIEHHATPEYPKGPAVLDAFLKEQIDFAAPGCNLLNAARFRCYFHALSPSIDRDSIPVPQLPNPFGEHLLNKLYQDLFFETVPCVVRAETANARATGLPTLYPYLDADVMLQGFSTPLTMRYRDGITKAVVRKATQGLVPDSARNNATKRGWNAPVDQWLRGRMNQEIEEILSERSIRERGVYDIPTIRGMLAEHVSGQRNHMMFFWQFISYERWHRDITAADA